VNIVNNITFTDNRSCGRAECQRCLNMKYCVKIKSFLVMTLAGSISSPEKVICRNSPGHYDRERDLLERDLDFCLSAERDLERLYDLSLLTGEYVGDPLDLRGDLDRDLDFDLDLLEELPPPPP